MKNLVIDFGKLAENDKTAPKDLLKVFKTAGAEIANSWVGKAKRDSGVSFKPVFLVFADNQQIELRVKQTGDIYEVRLNGKAKPIKEQDDQKKAIAEVVNFVEANSNRFQTMLTKKIVKMPNDIQTTLKTLETTTADRKAELQAAIVEIKAEIETLEAELKAA